MMLLLVENSENIGLAFTIIGPIMKFVQRTDKMDWLTKNFRRAIHADRLTDSNEHLSN